MNRCVYFGRHLAEAEDGTCTDCGEVVEDEDRQHGGLYNRKQRKPGNGISEVCSQQGQGNLS